METVELFRLAVDVLRGVNLLLDALETSGVSEDDLTDEYRAELRLRRRMKLERVRELTPIPDGPAGTGGAGDDTPPEGGPQGG